MKKTRSKNPYRRMSFPIKTHQDLKTKRLYIVDSEQVKVGEIFTKADAQTVEDSLNYIGKALGLLADMLSAEEVNTPHPKAPPNMVAARQFLIEEVFNFLIDLGIIEEPKPDYKKNFDEWAESIVVRREEPAWTELYHMLKNAGYFNETNGQRKGTT